VTRDQFPANPEVRWVPGRPPPCWRTPNSPVQKGEMWKERDRERETERERKGEKERERERKREKEREREREREASNGKSMNNVHREQG